jgi:hypothetical protein
MHEPNNRGTSIRWAVINGLLVAAGIAWWGWLDWQYVTGGWSADEMRSATAPIAPSLTVAAMLANLFVLRRRRALVHVGGALASTVAVLALWWAVIALAGGAFHVAIGGDA